MKVIRTLAVATLLTTVASVARAQTTLPFHQGQWGLQADANGNSGALLRFMTERTALVLGADVSHSSFESGGNATPAHGSYNVSSFSFGVRTHRPLAQNLASTFDAGLAAAWVRQTADYGGPFGPTRSRDRMIGPFVAFGAQYLVGGRLGVGAAYELSARWGKETFSDANTRTRQSSRAYGAGFRPIYATLYF